MDTGKQNVVMLTFEKTQKYYYLNRMKYIEVASWNILVRFAKNIKNSWLEKKKYTDFKVKWQKKMEK